MVSHLKKIPSGQIGNIKVSKNAVTIGKCVWKEKLVKANSFSVHILRLREIEWVIASRYGQFLPQADIATSFIRAAALALSGQDMFEWCKRWAPWTSGETIEAVMEEAKGRRYYQRADDVAELLGVTYVEREELGLNTIGACDVSKLQRRQFAKAHKQKRDRERQREKRRAEGRRDRKSVDAQSLMHSRPWEAEQMSRRTWYRRRGTAVSQVGNLIIGDTRVPSGEFPPPPTPLRNVPPVIAAPGAKGPGPRVVSLGSDFDNSSQQHQIGKAYGE